MRVLYRTTCGDCTLNSSFRAVLRGTSLTLSTCVQASGLSLLVVRSLSLWLQLSSGVRRLAGLQSFRKIVRGLSVSLAKALMIRRDCCLLRSGPSRRLAAFRSIHVPLFLD